MRSVGLIHRAVCIGSNIINGAAKGGSSLGALRAMATTTTNSVVVLPRDTNQAKGLGQFAIDFVHGKYNDGRVDAKVLDLIKLFHTDSVLCGLSAIAWKTNAPNILRQEALTYHASHGGARVFGSPISCCTEKAVVANCSAVREWDSNGTVFGYNASVPGHQAGEFGHNDFYPVVVAACQAKATLNGMHAVRGMICIDEIRGRLSEVFSLKTYKLDHVVHGAIASAAVYGALVGATADQIESAIGMTVSHYIPYRAIRAGKQLSDSKGASAALSAEVAVLSMKRSIMGFAGPRDIFRNPESIFRWNEKQEDGHSPFNLILTHSGTDFAVCGMHFKLGLYEHQSAGALEGLISLLTKHPEIFRNHSKIKQILVKSYEPGFGIIGDPAKRDPQTRQSADHSMVYIISTMLRKAIEMKEVPGDMDQAWCNLMLSPLDYSRDAIANTFTKELMRLVDFQHGGKEFDDRYPDGIPTSLDIKMEDGTVYTSGMVMYPTGHARNTTADLRAVLDHKFQLLGEMATDPAALLTLLTRLNALENCSNEELQDLYMVKSFKDHQPID
eukprot:GHVS01053517.1.p1 GENE.GHVS01053517.1~~GHVS01053517.1.p1  ORF type:complete len:557 (-),score=66.32 GHVS01053517.1:164-1834(-)